MAEASQSELYFFIKMIVYNDHSAPDILYTVRILSAYDVYKTLSRSSEQVKDCHIKEMKVLVENQLAQLRKMYN